MSGTDVRTYMIVIQQIVGNERAHSTTYSREGTLFTDRAAAIAHGIEELGHDDFNIATLDGGRLVAFGWDHRDFTDDDGYDLAEIARHLCLPTRALAGEMVPVRYVEDEAEIAAAMEQIEESRRRRGER